MTTAEFAAKLHAVKTTSGWKACCPAHDDKHPSLDIAEGEGGRTLIICRAGCTPKDVVAAAGLRMSDLFPDKHKVSTPPPPFDWQKHVASFTEQDALKLAEWRGFSPDFVRWLHAQGSVGTFKGNVAFPNHGAAGQVVSCHVRLESGNWLFEPKGQRTAPLIFGDVATAGFILAFESQWDAFAIMDKLGWHTANGQPDTAIFITRGAGNGRLAKGCFSSDTVVYAFEQNEAPKPGKTLSPAQQWTSALAADAGCQVLHVATPAPHKDANDWAILGATKAQIEAAMLAAKPVQAAAPTVAPARADSADPVESARAGKPYALSDLGNGERLVFYHGENLCWDTARKMWRTWDGSRWTIDSCLDVQRRAADSARRIRLEAAAIPSSGGSRDDPAKRLFSWALSSESRDKLAAAIELSKSRPGIAVQAGAFDSDPWKLNVLNGIIDLKTGQLNPHDKAARMTKIVPVEYLPGHQDERWMKFLHDATGADEDLQAFLQLAAGYTLTGDVSEENLFLVYGPTAGGKSTFLEALRAILGDYSRAIQPDLLVKQRTPRSGGNASPELAALAGVRLAAGSEMEQGREIAEALVKNLTGGEAITARHLWAELFDYHPQFKLWLTMNHCPRVSADDDAIWRRILRIGFDYTIPPELRDKTLKPYLRAPTGGAPAVLAWAVEGCLRWQHEGLKIPDTVSRSTDAYRQESDPLASFLEDCLAFTESTWEPWGDVWSAYQAHSNELGTDQRYRVAPRRLQEKLRALGCVADKRHEGRGWLNVSIRSAWQGRNP